MYLVPSLQLIYIYFSAQPKYCLCQDILRSQTARIAIYSYFLECYDFILILYKFPICHIR